MQDYAAGYEGKCLSDKYEGCTSKLLWVCKEGHQWKDTYLNLKANSKWCYQCKRSEEWQSKLDELKAFATEKGGKCLTEKYINAKTKLKFECSKGHQWLALPINMYKHRVWCSQCRERKILSREYLNNLASEYGGEYLTKGKVYSVTRLDWKCKEGHLWKASIHTIRKGGWCPVCVERKRGRKVIYTIEKLKSIALNKGGKLLSDQYTDRNSYLLWECKYGHQWKARIIGIAFDRCWCPHCPRWNKLSLQKVIEMTKAHGDKCLSKEYKNCWSLMEFECSKGHLYSKSVNNIKRGLWCPVCGKVNAQIKNLGTRKKNKAAREKDKLMNDKSELNSTK